MTHDASVGFNILYRQQEIVVCPFSYSSYRQIQKKIRTFSVAGLTSMVVVAVITSLVTNLLFGGKQPTFAASFGWTQTSFLGGATTTLATHIGDQLGWPFFLSKDEAVNITATGSVNLIAINSTTTQTSDQDFSGGVTDNTLVTGTGTSSVVGLDFGTGTITKTSDSDFAGGSYSSAEIIGGGPSADIQLASLATSGTYISNAINLGGPKKFDLQKFTFSATIPTEIAGDRVQIQVSRDGTNWYGPDATSTRYYGTPDCTVSAGTYICDLTTTAGMLNGTSNLYYKVFLSTPIGSYNVSFNDITFNYISQNSGTFESETIDFGIKATPQTLAINPTNQIALPEENSPWTKMASITANSYGGNAVWDKGNYIYSVFGSFNFYRYSISGNVWSNMANIPENSTYGSGLVFDGNDYIYMRTSGLDFYRYSISGNSWLKMTDAPGIANLGSLSYPGSGDFIYSLRGGNTNTDFYRYSISGNSWVSLAPTLITYNNSSSLVSPGSGDYLYAQIDNNFYRYSIAGNSWLLISSMPVGTSLTGNVLTSDGADYIYYFGNPLYRFSISRNTWEQKNNAPEGGNNPGANLIYVGSNKSLYYVSGLSLNFFKYSIDNDYESAWQKMPDAPSAIGTAGGAGLVDGGDGNLYALKGNGTNIFWKYNKNTNTWSTVANTPVNITGGSSLVSDNMGNLYLGNNLTGFWRYNINSNPGQGIVADTWTTLPNKTTGNGSGVSLVYVEKYHAIYHWPGNNSGSNGFYRFDIDANSWSSNLTCPGNQLIPNSEVLAYDGNNGIYMLSSLGSDYFYKYDILSNTWAQKNFAAGITNQSGLQYYNGYLYDMRDGLYLDRYNPRTDIWSKFEKLPFSMTYNGGSIANSNDGYFYMFRAGNSTEFYRYRIPDNSIRYQVATNNDNTTWNYIGPDGTSQSYFGEAGATIINFATSTASTILTNKRYFRYKATFVSTNNNYTPTLDSVSVGSASIPASSSLISSPYDTRDATNLLAKVQWTSLVDASSSVSFQLRTSPDATTWTEWHGPTGTSSQFVDSSGSETIPALMTDGVDDQYIQYKAILGSDGLASPTLTGATLTYVVNASPEIAITSGTTTLSATGTVSLSYQVRDIDSVTGKTPGTVMVRLEYCTADCNTGSPTWSIAGTSSLAGQFSTTTINTASSTTWTDYTLTWTPKAEWANQYLASSTNFRIRLVDDDFELANNLGISETNAFTLDTRDPQAGGTSQIVKIDASGASVTGSYPANIVLDATDNSYLEMKIGVFSPITDQANWEALPWVPYSSTATATISTDPDTVYVQFRDEYGNLTSATAVTPETPINMLIRDLGNAETGTYIEFISWKAVSLNPSDFKSYNVYRGEGTETDTPASYVLYATISTSSRNYFVDTTVAPSITYYYKVTTEDSLGNISYSSAIQKDLPDGQGGTDNTPPIIKGVEILSTTTQGATIAWDTDELSNSTIGFSLTPADFTGTAGIDTMVNYSTTTASSYGYDPATAVGRHIVVLANLTPGQAYYFQVKAADPQGNYATDNSGGDGYIFQTKPGPIISGVTPSHIDNFSADIVWTTDKPANSLVFYSINPDMTEPTQVDGSIERRTDHLVNVTGMQPGKKYYYYVASTDEDDNQAIDKNTVGGVDILYNFITTNDLIAPTISDIGCSLASDSGLAVRWLTDEPATGQIYYGSSPSGLGATTTLGYASSTNLDISLNVKHSMDLINLIASTTYYFKVIAADSSGNTSTSSEQTCDTTEQLTLETEVKLREAAAKAAGAAQAQAEVRGQGGSGVIIIDKTDKVAPVISNIKLLNLYATSAVVNWMTNERANGLIKYYLGSEFGSEGDELLNIEHSFLLTKLAPKSDYVYQLYSADASGNLANSTRLTFTTPDYTSSELEFLSSTTAAEGEADNERLMKTVAEKALEAFKRLVGQVSLSSFEEIVLDQINGLNELASIVPGPVLGGQPTVETTPSTATIHWNTDKPANSLVAYTPEILYSPTKGVRAYTQVVGEANQAVIDHTVVIFGLKPDTTYHYQLRSKAKIGPEATSRDFTFKTRPEALEIISANTEILSTQKARFKWLTSGETNTQLTYVPYRNGKLTGEESKSILEKNLTTNHDILVTDLEAGVIYQIELSGINTKGIKISKVLNFFSTTKDDLPPEITGITTESALSQGKNVKVQSVISWYTNELTICNIKYAEGAVTDETKLMESTQTEVNYSRKHTSVITKFDSGKIYSYRVYCSDSGDNKSISSAHTILTPRQSESVFDLIIKTLEETFGWVGKMK